MTLKLNVKKKWYDMILSGEKKEEYREIKPYWISRLTFLPSDWAKDVNASITELDSNETEAWDYSIRQIEFKNGYSKNAPSMIVECEYIEIGKAKPEWSDNWQGKVFVIHLGKIL